jgi:hypothetical protein
MTQLWRYRHFGGSQAVANPSKVHRLEALLQLIGLVPWRWIIDGLLMVIDGY